MSEFDLLTDAWIPVLTLDGAPEEVGLLACLERAHELREIADQSPLVTFGIHRLLAAALQTHLPLASLDDWADAWERGRFDADLIESVRTGGAARMRLFDAERPFYQSQEVQPRPPKSADKTIGYLRLEASTGTNVTHFSHPGDADHAYCAACCARGLVTLPPFALAGGAGIRPSINGVPPFYVLPRGSTLFRTLMLNHPVAPFLPSLATAKDPGPLWSRDDAAVCAEQRGGVGFVESLTWPPRQARLLPEAGGICSQCGRAAPVLVRKMHFAQGWYRDREAPVWDDPWGVYELRVDGGQKVRGQRRPHEGRDVWRDFALLFLDRTGEDRGVRPAIVRQIARLDQDGLIALADVQFEVFGLRTDMKAKVFEARHDGFEFPTALLRPGPARTIADALGLAEQIASQLVYALRELHPESDREKKDRKRIAAAMAALASLWERRFWQRLEPSFRRSQNDVRLTGLQADQSLWLGGWRGRLREAGDATLEEALEAAEADAEGLRRQVKARRSFYGRVKEILATTETEGGKDA